MAAVSDIAGQDSYPAQEAARRYAFKRDRQHLRYSLDVQFSYNAKTGRYHLQDAGPFAYLELSPTGLQALQVLLEMFANDLGEQAGVRPLLDILVERLSPESRLRLETRQGWFEVNMLQGIDDTVLKENVVSKVNRAARENRKLSFNHTSPSHADGLPRYYEVAPVEVRFRRGHWYLYAYVLICRDAAGEQKHDIGYRSFRLSYILDDADLQVLPGKAPANRRRPPRHFIHYRLLPAIGRGAISQHFEDMRVLRLPDGSVEVTGFTDDLFEAVRIFLGYGENCMVLGGDEVYKEMVRRVRGMAEHYGY
jgi:predicted DNA-binding transcriptional regulator YafY